MRRYEEAIATLKKMSSRNPNIFHAQLILLVAYSDLGQEEKAQTATAEVLRIRPKFSLESMRQTWPYKDSTIAERHVAALRKAGLK